MFSSPSPRRRGAARSRLRRTSRASALPGIHQPGFVSPTCWNDKYHFDFWRPATAIARAGEDGNPATVAQAGWTPLRSAPYPEHPSGHTCLDGAHMGAMQSFFGTDEMGFDVTSFVVPGASHVARFSEPLAEIEDARVSAGLHFRTVDEQGRQLGENIADYMADHYFQPVGRP